MRGNTNPKELTPDQEYEFYSDPRNQEPQGPPRRRKRPLSAPVPVRFPEELKAPFERFLPHTSPDSEID